MFSCLVKTLAILLILSVPVLSSQTLAKNSTSPFANTTLTSAKTCPENWDQYCCGGFVSVSAELSINKTTATLEELEVEEVAAEFCFLASLSMEDNESMCEILKISNMLCCKAAANMATFTDAFFPTPDDCESL